MESSRNIPGAAFWHSVTMADKLFKLKLKHRFAELGISTAEAMALLLLAHAGEGRPSPDEALQAQVRSMTQDQMIAALHYDKGFMTRTMRGLSQRGLVLKSANPADARSVVYSLAEAGADLVPGIQQRLEGWSRALTEGLTQEQVESFQETLSILISNASRA